jgi:hypothetical protein
MSPQTDAATPPEPAGDNDLERAIRIPHYLRLLLAMIAHNEDVAPEVEPDASFDPPWWFFRPPGRHARRAPAVSLDEGARLVVRTLPRILIVEGARHGRAGAPDRARAVAPALSGPAFVRGRPGYAKDNLISLLRQPGFSA